MTWCSRALLHKLSFSLVWVYRMHHHMPQPVLSLVSSLSPLLMSVFFIPFCRTWPRVGAHYWRGGGTKILARVKVFWLPKNQKLIQNQVSNESKVFLTSQDFPATLNLNIYHAVLHWLLWYVMPAHATWSPSVWQWDCMLWLQSFYCTRQVSCSL